MWCSVNIVCDVQIHKMCEDSAHSVQRADTPKSVSSVCIMEKCALFAKNLFVEAFLYKIYEYSWSISLKEEKQ